MKKLSIYSLFALVMLAAFASCGKSHKAQTVNLKNQNDTLNYIYGYLNGIGLRQEFMIEEKDEDKALTAFLDELDKSYTSTEDASVYDTGKKLGHLFQIPEKQGLMGEEELVFNYESAKQGVIDQLNGEALMSEAQAQEILQMAMFQVQMQRMSSGDQGGYNPYGEPGVEDVIIEEDVNVPAE